MKKNHEIKLLGTKTVVRTDTSDPELADQIIDLVNRKLRRAELRMKIQSPQQVALLALLELAEEYLHAKRKTAEFKRQYSARTSKLLGLIETDGMPT